MGKEIKIDERDITELLGEKVTVCILQLKSPFYDECTNVPVRGFNVLSWNKDKLQKRKEKILSLLDLVKAEDYRKDVNIIVLPEYSIHYEMMENLQDFANSKSVILIGTYYDDRKYIKKKGNKNFRKNICSVILPNRKREEFVKLDKTRFEADFIEDPEDNEKRVLRFYWQVNEHKLCLQIFVCSDFFNLDEINRKQGGIIIVPACSLKIEEFKLYSRECIKPHPESKVVRCVFVCNAVSLPEQQTELRIIGNSQIFGPYEGKLPILDTGVEGGIIASVNGLNIITKPSAISSKYNTVIENPISFCIEEINGNWKIVETEPLFKREKPYPMTVAVSIVQKEYSFLMVRRKMPEGDLEWQFPAGIIRPKQDPKKRAVEEVFGETNVKCNVTGKIGERVHPDTEVTTIYYCCSYLSGEACNKDTGENVEVKWVKAWEVEKLVTSDLYSGIKELLIRIPRDE